MHDKSPPAGCPELQALEPPPRDSCGQWLTKRARHHARRQASFTFHRPPSYATFHHIVLSATVHYISFSAVLPYATTK